MGNENSIKNVMIQDTINSQLDLITVNVAACDLRGWLQSNLRLDLDLSLTKCNLSIYSNEYRHKVSLSKLFVYVYVCVCFYVIDDIQS